MKCWRIHEEAGLRPCQTIVDALLIFKHVTCVICEFLPPVNSFRTVLNISWEVGDLAINGELVEVKLMLITKMGPNGPSLYYPVCIGCL